FLSEEAPFFQPTFLIDREALYVIRKTQWTKDYWTDFQWMRVPQPRGTEAEPDFRESSPTLAQR
ncbi:MAG: hypothetical protein AAGJ31_08510, partial [Verrucomicrobiota bacterium]